MAWDFPVSRPNVLQTPPPDVHWHVKLCLTIPEGLGVPEVAQPGTPAVAYKGKLLLMVRTGLTVKTIHTVEPLYKGHS